MDYATILNVIAEYDYEQDPPAWSVQYRCLNTVDSTTVTINGSTMAWDTLGEVMDTAAETAGLTFAP